MKTNWRVRLNGKGASLVWDYPISESALIVELLKNWKQVEIIN